MAAYALAHLYELSNHPEVFEYIERIQSTMDPFGGRFLVHGTMPEVIEGEWPGTLVIIEFPDVDSARAWYASPAYQEILHLRTDHIPGAAILVDGVGANYDAVATAHKLRAAVR
ncbi:DUF1330 domain-containing protein [Cryptosporangium sp. NPDC048952]|uniref:DUF1330 domain-containing protein n=1 Tax=Cryptosporangium sp. NPDC048952 TaxID=3363961 RepID=UPI00372453C6